MKPLRIGLPSGSLQEATLELFRRAGFSIGANSRTYRPSIDDPSFEVRLIRAQEIAAYVQDGFLDLGLTGTDWIQETRAKVHVVSTLRFSKATAKPARWVIAVPNKSGIRRPAQLRGKRIATEAVGLVKQYLAKKRIKAKVEFSWGATEVKVPELADAIADITETGSSLVANGLRILDTVLESYPQLIANRKVWARPADRGRIENLNLLLEGALRARDLVGLKMNVPRSKVSLVSSALSSLRDPTVSPLSRDGWVAVETVMEEKTVRSLIPRLKQLGAEGIIEYPLNKVVT
ncbi:MAG: ATP phosphoribosyltransferase [Verrucomicrobia bacterium]|nr:ATP phosphoribosyltransferase [Verrucomicrobiota bacterium]NDF16813.1 ATP phosphoribosyltransferase [Verrucomicrobiota bacterium]